MQMLIFATRSKPNQSPKPMSAFANVVEDSWNFNYVIQMVLRTVQIFQANHSQSRIDRPPLTLWRAGVTLPR
jgi:hypothetical protein